MATHTNDTDISTLLSVIHDLHGQIEHLNNKYNAQTARTDRITRQMESLVRGLKDENKQLVQKLEEETARSDSLAERIECELGTCK